MKAYRVEINQKELLTSIFSLIFNPVKDINDDYFISENEYYFCLGLWYLDECPSELVFIKDLTSSVYEPKIIENPFV